MACGTPVVGFAAGASIEVVQLGVTGFLVPVGDEDGLCEAVGRIGEIDPAACRRHVTRRFSLRVMVDRYERLFLALAHELRADPRARRAPLAVTSPPRPPAPGAAAT